MICIFRSESMLTAAEWFLHQLSSFSSIYLQVLTKRSTIYIGHLRGLQTGVTKSECFHFPAPTSKQTPSTIWSPLPSGCMFTVGKACHGHGRISSRHGYGEPHFCLVDPFLRRVPLVSRKSQTSRVCLIEG